MSRTIHDAGIRYARDTCFQPEPARTLLQLLELGVARRE
jgi:hypothetical protein